MQNGQYHSFQWSSFACIESVAGLLPGRGDLFYTQGQLRLIDAKNDSLVFIRLSDGTRFKYLKVSGLPANCNVQVVDTALSQWTVLQQTLMSFDHKMPDKLSHKFEKAIRLIDSRIDDTEYSQIELFNVMKQALTAIGDKHAFLYSRQLGMYWSATEVPENKFQRKGVHHCNNAISVARSNKHVIVKISRLHSFEDNVTYDLGYSSCLNKLASELVAIKDLKHRNLVIDLRDNGGGSLVYAAQLLSILTSGKAQTLSYLNSFKIENNVSYPLTEQAKHRYVLINRNTVSAAEHLALALTHAGFTSAGELSAGAFSPAIVKTLPNGWFFGFSQYQKVFDSMKNPVPEKVGIQVQHRLSSERHDTSCHLDQIDTSIQSEPNLFSCRFHNLGLDKF